MKILYFSIGILLFGMCSSCDSKQQSSANIPDEDNSITYDSLMARQLSADEYGMKSYVFAFLKSGPNRSQDSTEHQILMRGHLDNISRLADEGKLVLAGPFMDAGSLRGIYIFNTASIAEADAWTRTDPAIQKGHLIMELKPWYGSASLALINDWHKKIQKQKI